MSDGVERRERIRTARALSGRRIVVLDDDPTGSQSVHGVEVVTTFERGDLARALAASDTVFVLTNSRSLPADEAAALSTALGRMVFEIAGELNVEIDIVSRSDSTLRGHVFTEVDALEHARRAATGRGYDAVLFAPCYLEAGRVTEGDTQWVVTPRGRVPVAETEFARDPTFGYSSSDLREFLAERSGGTIEPADVRSISLIDIRDGGPAEVARRLVAAPRGAWIVVNASDDSDLEIVTLGILEAERTGRRFLYRTGPSFVRALAGIDPREPLRAGDIWTHGRPTGHGLVVVGSHVGTTTRQLAELHRRFDDVTPVTLDVERALASSDRAYIDELVARVVAGLATSDVVLSTSRTVLTGRDADDSLRIARAVSDTVSSVVAGALVARPAWIVAKGGITSHDVATRGLGVRRAEVAGQLGRGIISLFRPLDAEPAAVGLPYVVFAGNVGDDRTLADVVATLRG